MNEVQLSLVLCGGYRAVITSCSAICERGSKYPPPSLLKIHIYLDTERSYAADE